MQIIDDKGLLGLDDKHIAYLDNAHGVHHQVVSAWQAMQLAAANDGIDLSLVSSFRSFDRQLTIWDRKFSGELSVYDINEQVVDTSLLTAYEKVKAIMLFSALPGASRHHWGTDIDVYSPSQLSPEMKFELAVWEYQAGGPMHSLYNWLVERAKEFDFFFPYDTYRGGVSSEPWHLSYAPIAAACQKKLTPSLLANCLMQSEINGKQEILLHIEQLFEQFIINIGDYPND